jgi:hypothetical protein
MQGIGAIGRSNQIRFYYAGGQGHIVQGDLNGGTWEPSADVPG